MSEEYPEIICTFCPFLDLKLFENKNVNIKKKYSYRLWKKENRIRKSKTNLKKVEYKKRPRYFNKHNTYKS